MRRRHINDDRLAMFPDGGRHMDSYMSKCLGLLVPILSNIHNRINVCKSRKKDLSNISLYRLSQPHLNDDPAGPLPPEAPEPPRTP